MSNSSPTILEKIRTAAMSESYAKARQVGESTGAAYSEAEMIGEFIDQAVEVRKEA
jgi:hypothetical protein